MLLVPSVGVSAQEVLADTGADTEVVEVTDEIGDTEGTVVGDTGDESVYIGEVEVTVDSTVDRDGGSDVESTGDWRDNFEVIEEEVTIEGG